MAETPKNGIVLVTGAGGFLGTTVVRTLISKGYRVRAMARNVPDSKVAGAEYVQGDMTDDTSVDTCVQGASAVVHLAARKSDEADSVEVNVEGAKRLIAAAKKHDVTRIVNIGTQSSRLKRRGIYGESKLQADALFSASGLPVVTLRPSVVYDGTGGGIMSTVVQMTNLPVVPMIGGGNVHLSPIHADDLALVIEAALRTDAAIGKTYDVGGPDSVTLKELTKKIMTRRGMKKPMVTLPLFAAMLIARCTRFLPKPPITVSNVLGAAEDMTMDIGPMLRDFGIAPRSLETGLNEMTLLNKKFDDEASVLLTYVLSSWKNWKSTDRMVKNYREALEKHRVPKTHVLDTTVLRKKWLLKAIDGAAASVKKPSVLRTKLLIAAAIAETSPESAALLLPKDRSAVSVVMQSVLLTLGAIVSTLIGLLITILRPSFFKRNAGI